MIILATLGGVGIVLSPVSEIQALFVAAVLNGLVSPFLLAFLMVVAFDRRVLREFRPHPAILATGWITAGTMALAAVALLATVLD